MKAPLLLFLLPFFHSGILAQNTTPASGIDTLPPCALTCLVTAVFHSPCALADIGCVCANAPLQSAVETCVLQSCTVKESLTTKNTTSTLCGAPIRDRGGELKGINIARAVLTQVSVIARILGKVTRLNASYDFGLDDMCLFVAAYLGLSNAIIIDRGTIPSGLGRDVWTLEFPTITNFVRWFYVMEVLYFVEITFLKLSILFFYTRIFTGERVRKLLWGTIAFNAASGVAFIFAGVFQCQPVSYYWTSWDGVKDGGKCFNIYAMAWANAAIGIALDLWMLGIPLFQVAKLNMALRKKIAVSLMFLAGAIVTIISILRLHSLVVFANSKNPTWDQWEIAHWSLVEVSVGIICACMPTFRSLLANVLPKVFGSTTGSSHQRHTDDRLRSQPNPLTDTKANIAVRLRESISTIVHTDSSGSRNKTEDDEVELVPFEDRKNDRRYP